jgi:hypothetical protein
MQQQAHTIGERVEKFCETCGETRGHVVASVTKYGHISRVSCPQCSTRSTFKNSDGATGRRSSTSVGTLYDPTRTYRTGQSLAHPVFGLGEVTALIEPRKIDVLFSDRLRRLIHGRAHG